MRLTHYQVHGEPVIRHMPYVGYYAVCPCGARTPEGSGYIRDMSEAVEAAKRHEQQVVFGLDFAYPVNAGEACTYLLTFARVENLRDIVIRNVAQASAADRAVIVEWCERALVAEIWRGNVSRPYNESEVEHALGVLVATAMDSPGKW